MTLDLLETVLDLMRQQSPEESPRRERSSGASTRGFGSAWERRVATVLAGPST
jgi:hypothetical protein